MTDEVFEVSSVKETKKLATRLADRLKGGEVICLIGNLGAGKTYFTKFLSEALGADETRVVSPTFVYWRQHRGKKLNIHHFDFYRIDNEQEIEDIGFEEALDDPKGVVIIEWADKIPSYLPKERIEIHIKAVSESKREFTVKAFGERYEKML